MKEGGLYQIEFFMHFNCVSREGKKIIKGWKKNPHNWGVVWREELLGFKVNRRKESLQLTEMQGYPKQNSNRGEKNYSTLVS